MTQYRYMGTLRPNVSIAPKRFVREVTVDGPRPTRHGESIVTASVKYDVTDQFEALALERGHAIPNEASA